MLKKYAFFFFLFASALCAVNPSYAKTAGGDADFDPDDEAKFIPAMAMVTDEDVEGAIASLEAQGIQVLRHRGNILLTLIPTEFNVSTLRKAKGVRKIEYSRRYNKPAMEKARQFNDAYLINEGMDLPMPYDGTGVVIGVCDIGMDTRHVNFLSADGSECRIRRVVHYQEEQGLRDVYSTPQEIYDWETDTDEDWHATHVVGIAAGAYSANGMQSLAPGADIVFTASQLSDVGLLAGVEDIIDYAKEVGKPAVINLSMGNTLGPHDGTSLFTQYLDRCIDDAIICISAGNNGEAANAAGYTLVKSFTSSDKSVSVLTTNWNGFYNYGEAQVWSENDSPVNLTLFLHSDSYPAEEEVFLKTLNFTETSEMTFRMSADPSDPDYDEVFASHFLEGDIVVKGGVSALNNRFNITVDLDCYTETASQWSNGDWAAYWPAIRVEGEPGQTIDIYAGGEIFLRGVSGNTWPGSTRSISDLATGHRTISVGMSNNRQSETYIDGRVEETRYEEGKVCPVSSYGTLLDGRVLPMTVAPGAVVISSISTPLLRKYPEAISSTNLVAEVDGNSYYWASNVGTSMSCPFVVSAIATWLQADPSLTAEEAVEIIKKTNVTDYPEPSNPRHGQGWFSPYAGLKEVVKKSGSVGVVSPGSLGVDMKYQNGWLRVANFSGSPSSLSVFSMSGSRVHSASVEEGHLSFDLNSLASGVYTVLIENNAGLRKVMKLFVR